MQQTCFYFSPSKVTVAGLFPLQQLYSLLIPRHESNKVLLTKPLSAVVATRGMIASVDQNFLCCSCYIMSLDATSYSFICPNYAKRFRKILFQSKFYPMRKRLCDHVTFKFYDMIFFYWQLQLDASYWYLACIRSRFEESIQRSNICILLLSRSPIAGPLPLWPWKLTQMDPSSIGLEAPTWWDTLTHVYTHTCTHTREHLFLLLPEEGRRGFHPLRFSSITFCTSCHCGSLV